MKRVIEKILSFVMYRKAREFPEIQIYLLKP